MKYEQNMTNELRDTDVNDTAPYERDDNMMTKVKWSINTDDIDSKFLREYDEMRKSMKDRQINDLYEAQRHLQSAMMGDTPVKTVQNRQYICHASARPPASQSTVPHFPSSMDGVRNQKGSKRPRPLELDNRTPPAKLDKAQFGA